MENQLSHIRNFSIIAHIDHGKSTLADRLLEHTHTLAAKEMKAQVLDSMDLERERGITIKSHPIRMVYKPDDNQEYIFNLIDTPGHVDFSYEVSRSLAACEGALVLVDAAQGVEAQTVSNVYMALENDLTIIPVINKIDLPSARTEVVTKQIVKLIGCDPDEIIKVSAKTGEGVTDLLNVVVDRVPPPDPPKDDTLKALIFDSMYDSYRGAVPYMRVMQGEIEPGMKIRFMSNNRTHEVTEVGVFRLERIKKEKLGPGEVGYLVASIKEVDDVRVGDTITDDKRPAEQQLPGYKAIKPMVFSGLYPVDTDDYEDLRSSLERLQLNDASLQYEPETSSALGFGFRCGFLGMLHMEIIQERLDREFDLDLITTVPNVRYRITTEEGETEELQNPSLMPDQGDIEKIEEPYVYAEIIVTDDYIGNIMQLCQDKRGVYKTTKYLDENTVELNYELPLSEIVFDFYDSLKSVSRGYASFDYEFIGYQESDLVKLDILIDGDPVDALSTVIHRDKAYRRGRSLCRKLRELIPRQMIEVPIQAAIGSNVIARETVRALRKNVTAKCYGGDVTRKRKLLEKQKEGKKRMKNVGKVTVPQEAFLAILQIDD
ncbi:MAG: translation elongation factor 4 [Candidatus Marinimicrobia bacterium]|nr:translation elongation factor 4 [Candidatus Neomarinimicrobiota bacterium]MCF7829756.1 translation elongation factor 4 [Candidatus Neomarinimicrobiota bacterium]MCF7881706.1 translation elongation factor 4 [Candidatus Neomarinimicrobiota bacterium]